METHGHGRWHAGLHTQMGGLSFIFLTMCRTFFLPHVQNVLAIIILFLSHGGSFIDAIGSCSCNDVCLFSMAEALFSELTTNYLCLYDVGLKPWPTSSFSSVLYGFLMCAGPGIARKVHPKLASNFFISANLSGRMAKVHSIWREGFHYKTLHFSVVV